MLLIAIICVHSNVGEGDTHHVLINLLALSRFSFEQSIYNKTLLPLTSTTRKNALLIYYYNMQI